MKIENVAKSYLPVLKRLYKYLYDKDDMKDVRWVRRDITKINSSLGELTNEHTRYKYHQAVSHVLNNGKRNTDYINNDNYEYGRQYRERYKDDETYKLFLRASQYLYKLNIPKERRTKNNHISNPSDKMIDKYGLYQAHNDTRWYSTVVDEYCQTQKSCRKN